MMIGKTLVIVLISVAVLLGVVLVPVIIWTGNRIESAIVSSIAPLYTEESVKEAMEEAFSEAFFEDFEEDLEDIPSDFDSNESGSGIPQEAQLDFENFHSIHIQAIHPDITIESGEDWNIEYCIPKREEIERCEVKDGVFYFDTDFAYHKKFSSGDWYLKITVPSTAELQAVSLESISGEISLNDLTVDSMKLNNVSDEISLSNVHAREGALKTISGDIELTGTEISTLTAASTSGDILVDGNSKKVSLETVSGDCSLQGAFGVSCNVKNVSGDISLSVSNPVAVDVESHGRITYNRDSYRNNFRLNQKDVPLFRAQSVSGNITIDAKES